MFTIIVIILELFLLVLFAYSILSWVIAAGHMAYDSPVRKIQNVLSAICEPVLRAGPAPPAPGPGRRRGTRSVGDDRVPRHPGGPHPAASPPEPTRLRGLARDCAAERDRRRSSREQSDPQSMDGSFRTASMAAMDASQSALDSLRTVEFRETLKGYHRDDVDEYLEKAAVEAEGLQEQLRQSGERLRQAAERISQLETALEQQPAPPAGRAGGPRRHPAADADAGPAVRRPDQGRCRGRGGADHRRGRVSARKMTQQAQVQATQIASESEQRLRDEINRLEESRTRLTHEVESMSRHLESERNRLRTR